MTDLSRGSISNRCILEELFFYHIIELIGRVPRLVLVLVIFWFLCYLGYHFVSSDLAAAAQRSTQHSSTTKSAQNQRYVMLTSNVDWLPLR